MRSTKATRWLSGTLAALMLAQGMCLPAGAWSWNSGRGSSNQTSQAMPLEAMADNVDLKDGTAVIPSDATEDEVKEILFDALVVNKDGIDPQSLDWEYYCEGTRNYVDHKKDWGSVFGGSFNDGFLGNYSYPALAANKDGDYQVQLVGTDTEVTLTKAAKLDSSITLNNGSYTVALPYNKEAQVDYDTLRESIFNTVVATTTPDLTAADVTIEYKYGRVAGQDLWGQLEGDDTPVVGYDPVKDGSYTFRISYAGNDTYYGDSEEVTVTITERSEAPYTPKETPDTVVLAVDENLNVDYDAVRESIFNAVVDSSDVLTADNVTITYYAEATSGSLGSLGHAWVPLEGGKSGGLSYPAISTGEQKIRIHFAGNQQYAPTTIDATVTVTNRPTAEIVTSETPSVKLALTEGMQLDTNKLYSDVFQAIIASSTPVLTVNDVTITYYAEATTGSLGSLGHAWVPLEGGTSGGLTYPAMPAGTQQVRIYWPGNQQYAPTTIEATVTVNDRDQVQFTLNDGPYEVGMKFTAEQGYDYAATAKVIYDAVVASTVNPEGLTANDVTVEYNTDKTGLTHISYKPLNEADATGLVKFGTGTWEIRISWAGNQEYRGGSVTVNVTTTDNRIASSVALKSGASFTYNMDADAMKQAIFDNVIDWDNSTLPAKETLSPDNFVIEYKAKLTDAESGVDLGLDDLKDLFGKLPGMDDFLNNDILTQWVPLEGEDYEIFGQLIGSYPQIGAGENQSIRISYKGNADYRPSDNAEGTVTVNKAKVSVKVNSTNIYADDELPAGFITTDPADEFDIYTIYAGITSNVTTGIYLDLPERYTADGSLLLQLIDKALAAANQKTLTQMLNEGVTVGELRQMFSTQELLDLLDKLNIDTGTFGQILTVVNNLPGILDSVRISFGTPNRAGLYTVAAVTDNKNYETGVGIGFLLAKMHFSGPKLTWDQEMDGGKLTAEQAKSFDFGATLYYDGLPVDDQSSVHYLYSGFTSKWRIYSSTTTPPTEPGRYVVTVCILGGNYMAAPITRSFQITK